MIQFFDETDGKSLFMNRKNKSGFTLIELLVVVSIIGLLSSIVLASLSSARTKAQDSAIKSQVLQFRTLMELEYNTTGSYTNLNKGWVGMGSINRTCSNLGYAGSYGTKAVDMCTSIFNAIVNKTENNIYTGVNTDNSRSYSIMARLSSGFFFCAGSSGRTSDQGNGTDGWTGTGCYANP